MTLILTVLYEYQGKTGENHRTVANVAEKYLASPAISLMMSEIFLKFLNSPKTKK